MWRVASIEEFDSWFAQLGDEEREEIIAKVELLKILGPQLGRPHADTLKGSKHANMKELRGKTASAVLRVAFAFDQTRAAILLVGGNKAGVNQRKFYKTLISKADRFYDEHLSRVKQQRK